MANVAKTSELLAQAGLPQFESGEDGYPHPGKVVKYYRERLTYTDRDGKAKHWTQADLAKVLGLKETMVNLMENRNQGLDSIERRRTLSSILRIPPVLLGLGSLDAIVEIVTGHEVTPISADEKKNKVSKSTIKQYQATFKVYETLFAGGLTYASIQDVDKWTKKIERDVQDAHEEDKNELLRTLWDYEILCAKIYGSDLYNWTKCFEHTDNAIEIATVLDNRDLQAASLYTSGVYHLRQGRYGLAKIDIENALTYAKGALPQTRGIIYSLEAFRNVEDRGLAGALLTQNLLDQAEKYAGIPSEIKTIKFGKGPYLIHRAEALIRLNRPAKALDFIEDAERHIGSTKKRYHVFMNILRAKCYAEMKKPEYEQAVSLLAEAIEDSKELRVQRHIDHIDKLYKKLVNSEYGNAPDVAELGHGIRELKLMTL